MKRPSCYISIVVSFTKGNQENAYQPAGDMKTKKAGESASTGHGAFAISVSVPVVMEGGTPSSFVELSTGSMRFPKGLRHHTLPELGILVPRRGLALVHPCCVHYTLLLQLRKVKILVIKCVTSLLFLNFNSECQLFGVDILIIGRTLTHDR